MTPIPFAGLAPDARLVRGGGDLSFLDVQHATQIGAAFRRATAGAESVEDVAGAVLDAMNVFELGARPAWALLRAFVTRRFRDLPPDLRTAVGQASTPPDAPCLQLVATRGIEPDWNDVAKSVAHRVLLLDESRGRMVAELAHQLLLEDPARP